ncbi:MAG: hypothetical protein IKG30_03650 [Clostridiales bacterium]|nr:hypothetical protein [Clostridiales bacterium]
MNKYNEIMSNITVDPEMKSRIMSAVSASISKQSGSAGRPERIERAERTEKTERTERSDTARTARPVREAKVREPAVVTNIPKEDKETEAPVVRKKAKKTPVVIISSIAAGILVIAGVLFVFSNMSASTSPQSTKAMDIHSLSGQHNSAAETQADSVREAEAIVAADEAVTDGVEDEHTKNNNYSVSGDNKNTLAAETTNITTVASGDTREGMGDARIEKISRALPFDMKGSGTGTFSDTITEEVFFGDNGEKVVIFSAPGGTDILNEVYHIENAAGVDGTTPEGTAVKYYRIAFGNVDDLAEGETSEEINAAVYTKGGKTYLMIFSDIQSEDVIGKVIDAV